MQRLLNLMIHHFWELQDLCLLDSAYTELVMFDTENSHVKSVALMFITNVFMRAPIY